MENKVCRKCNMDLPITDYNKPNKNGYYDYKCKKCYREEYRETKGAEVAERKRLKRAMLEEKGVKVCKGCNIELPLFKFLTNKIRKICFRQLFGMMHHFDDYFFNFFN